MKKIIFLTTVSLFLIATFAYSEIDTNAVVEELRTFSQEKDYFYEMPEEDVIRLIDNLKKVQIGDSLDHVLSTLKIEPTRILKYYYYKYFLFKRIRYTSVLYQVKTLHQYANVENYDKRFTLFFDKNNKLEEIYSNIRPLYEQDYIK